MKRTGMKMKPSVCSQRGSRGPGGIAASVARGGVPSARPSGERIPSAPAARTGLALASATVGTLARGGCVPGGRNAPGGCGGDRVQAGRAPKGAAMPRIQTIPPDAASGELADAYDRVHDAGFPAVPTVFQLVSLRPDLVRNLAEAYRLMFGVGKLQRATKEGIATWVSALNQSQYRREAQGAALQLGGATEKRGRAARKGAADAFSKEEGTGRFLRLAEKIPRHAYKVT